jgi:hypothetical protein
MAEIGKAGPGNQADIARTDHNHAHRGNPRSKKKQPAIWPAFRVSVQKRCRNRNRQSTAAPLGVNDGIGYSCRRSGMGSCFSVPFGKSR